MASVHGREERAGNNYAQEDSPCPLWCIEDYCVDLTREDWTRSGDLETQEQDDNNNIHRLDETADFEVEDRVKNADPETGLQQEEEPDFCRQGCVKEDGEE
ncbi:hypothetical protein Bbelb_031090 [Branchiostoma belcheri]|nr:hypothetical protein Bbelb_031090 [Branchiostoma belcheri]